MGLCTRDGFTFHSLRRTMASQAANNGARLEVIEKLGNWSDGRMVACYAKFSDETLRDAAAILSHSVTPVSGAEPVAGQAVRECA